MRLTATRWAEALGFGASRSPARTAAPRRSGLRVAWVVTASLALSACGGQIEGALTPVPDAVGVGSIVDILVATTREPTADQASLFTGERGPRLAFVDIAVSIPPDNARTVGEVQRAKSATGDPKRDFVVVSTQHLELQQAIDTFNGRVKSVPGRRVMVFVHGYNNRFDDAVFRLAQIVHDSDAEVVPLLFTWPSRGSLLAYGYDRESANYSRTELETVLRALARDKTVAEVNILAHSMGNWLTMEALRQMAIRDGSISPKITTVMLAAPDVDVDVFREQMRDIGPDRPDMVLFVSGDDRALAVSRRLWQSSARLGSIDPSQEPYRTEIENTGLTVIDLTKVESGDRLHHGKFAQSPEVVRLIGTRLMEGQTLTDQHASFGDRVIQLSTGVATAAGTAVGMAVSAPVAVVDPSTRRTFNDTLEATLASSPPMVEEDKPVVEGSTSQ
ncbi:esterase [Acuticoccus sediminis]|uniref:Esterase n=1 Tax=Acuticoccus sediminis TaxID=2184697 RepID=A0A8B2P0F0_9HYPH|nr:alpha/beta hydrolase [Acuticoccus sediminis]RAI02280.1 esterase [Acuticoccus sediminis]